MNSKLIPPYLGAANNSTFFDQPGGTCPPPRILNVRPFTVDEERPEVGQRPGIVKAFPQQMGGGAPGQGCGIVSRSRAISGYRIGERVPLDGVGRSTIPAALLGQVWAIARNFGMFLRRYENVSAGGEFADTGPADQSVIDAKYTLDETKIVYASNYISTGDGLLHGRVTCIDAHSGAMLWSRKISRTIGLIAHATYVNSLCCSANQVWVCTNEFVRGLNLTDGTTFGVEFDCNGWSQECVQAVLTPEGTHLLIAFRGTTSATTLHSGVVVGGPLKAGIWRSGVMKAAIQPAGSSVALIGVAFGAQLPITDRYYEGPYPTYAPHNYLRLSEVLTGCGPSVALASRFPRGRWPTGIAMLPNGGFVVSHTNSGYGPNSNSAHTVANGWPANDYAPPDAPYYTLSIFDSGGALQGNSIDTYSLVELKADGFRSDIPNDSSQDPSILAVAASADGTIYAGGIVANGSNVFAFSQEGNALWAVNLGQTIRQNGINACKDDQTGLFGGDRSNTWPSSGAANAILWKLQKDTGAVVKHFDLGSAVSCLGVASNARGDIAFVSDKVP